MYIVNVKHNIVNVTCVKICLFTGNSVFEVSRKDSGSVSMTNHPKFSVQTADGNQLPHSGLFRV